MKKFIELFESKSIVHSRSLPPKQLLYPVIDSRTKKKYYRVLWKTENKNMWLDIPEKDVVAIKVYASPFNQWLCHLLRKPVKNKNYRLSVQSDSSK